MKRLLISASVLTLAACGAQEPTIETPAAPEPEAATELLMPLPEQTSADITAEDLAVRIKTLADDTFEGRGPGTPAGEASADWIAAEMSRIGLEPAGDNGSFFQTVEMVNQTVDTDASFFQLTTPDGTELPMTPKEDVVFWTKRQNTNELAFDPTDVVFVGYGSEIGRAHV